MALVQAGRFCADELFLLGIPELISIKNDDLKSACERNQPGSGLHQLGEAVHAMHDHRLNRVEGLLAKLVARFPQLGVVQSLQGRLYLERDELDHLLAWHQTLPQSVSNYPEIWFVRGLWAERSGQDRAYVRCLLETIQSNPNHVEANYRLSQVFHHLGNQEAAARFSQRSERLSKLAYVVNDLRGNPDLRLLKQATEELTALGRGWEALAWAKVAREFAERESLEHAWVDDCWEQLRTRAGTVSHQIAPEFHPLNGFDLEEYPLPVWVRLEEIHPAEPDNSPAPASMEDLAAIRYGDLAEEAQLKFRYFNSMDPKVGLEHIFQTTGGGMAVLDYDGDFWPDLYFAQGRPLPKTLKGFNTPQSQYRDQLFRNLGDGQFQEVTAFSLLGDDRFSQGVTQGDFNNDGFADLYVCNVGGNRFYENNGDGTFREIANQTNTAGNEWSMSSMLADLDADGFSDLYVVNYLNAEQVLARSCRQNGQPLTCAPTLFDAERDRVYWNKGDGSFEEVTDAAGIVKENGKGLGIVALDVEGRGKLNVFIANDTTANNYYKNTTALQGPLRFEEAALFSGLALSKSGHAEACMGVAAGDSNGDGLTDLYITNFIRDYNTLYLQKPDGFFSDVSHEAKLIAPSVEMLGFGTQFLDANLDGHLDLLITNGHVDQALATGEPDRMPPQFLLNAGKTFQEASPHTLGPFFEQKHIGRALARWDWNRDGKDDAAIVHLDAPIALLTNLTPTENHWVAIHLRGVQASRDAVGAKVTIQLDDRVLTRELTGGDGYQVCNERKLIFGLGEEETIQEIIIAWPSGRRQRFGPIPSNQEWLAIEGRDGLPLQVEH